MLIRRLKVSGLLSFGPKEKRRSADDFYYRFEQGDPVLKDLSQRRRELRRESVKPEQSILSQLRDPESYPILHWLQEQYEKIRLYRDWSFGPSASWRREQSAQIRNDFLSDNSSCVVVCSKENGESRFERLDEASLKEWLEKYSLGDLWSMGELGGNRW